MKISDTLNLYTLQIEREEDDTSFPIIETTISVFMPCLEASFPEIWIERSKIENFITGLKQVQKNLKKVIDLQSVSPDEYSLKIEKLVQSEELELTVRLQQQVCVNYGSKRLLEVSFRIASNSLPQMISELKCL